MKKTVLLFFIFFIQVLSFSQQFTWMKGTNNLNQVGLYGTIGIPSSTTNPGSRHGCATWTDLQGNLWLFGGEGLSNTNALCWLSDLWKYDPTTDQWTWVKGPNTASQIGVYGTMGIPNAVNQPGAREFSISWTDASGNFWLFGGDGFATNATFGKLGDLWKYDPSTNQWTWINGFNSVNQNGIYGTLGMASPSNLPGGRYGSGNWIDGSGNLWLFGGRGMPIAGAAGHLNDLWKYNPSSNQWTWVNGTNTISQNSIYGTLNVSSASNAPGGVEFPSSWNDAGNLYLFGGRGYYSAGIGYLNSFWKYTFSTNQWTWIGGQNAGNPLGNYGTLGVSSPTNFPGGRMSAASWSDGVGNVWLFGGLGVPSTLMVGELNDLFRFNTTTNEWTWMKGSNTNYQNGIYGTQGLSAPTNMPGARRFNTFWKGNNNQFWLFGGEGYDVSSGPDNLDDLWKFIPSCNPENIVSLPSQTLCSGNTVTLSANGSSTAAVLWYTSPSGGSSIGTGTQLVTPNLTAVNSNSIYTYYAESNNCTAYARTPISLTVNALPTVTISGNNSICIQQAITLSVTGTAISYSWSNGANTNSIIETPTITSTYSVVVTGSNSCLNSAIKTVTVNPLPLLSIQGNTSVCFGSPLSLNANGSAISFTWSEGSNTQSIIVSPTVSNSYFVTGQDINGCQNTASQSVTVLALPPLSVSSKSVICLGENTSLNASGATSYTWNTGQTTSVIVVSPSQTSSYTLTGQGSNGCNKVIVVSITVSNCTAIDETTETKLTSLELFPNPSSGSIQIKSNHGFALNFQILNSLGELVFKTKLLNERSQLNLELAPGIYFYSFHADKGLLGSGKLIIE